MIIDVYIGDLSDPTFKWEGGNWNGNVPKRISPMFPAGHDIFFALLRGIKNETLTGKQVDWAGWVAKMKPSELERFIVQSYEKYQAFDHIMNSLEKIKTFISTLDPAKEYALVGCET